MVWIILLGDKMGHLKDSFIEYQIKTMSRKIDEIEKLQQNIHSLQMIIDDNHKAIKVFIKNIEGEL